MRSPTAATSSSARQRWGYVAALIAAATLLLAASTRLLDGTGSLDQARSALPTSRTLVLESVPYLRGYLLQGPVNTTAQSSVMDTEGKAAMSRSLRNPLAPRVSNHHLTSPAAIRAPDRAMTIEGMDMQARLDGVIVLDSSTNVSRNATDTEFVTGQYCGQRG